MSAPTTPMGVSVEPARSEATPQASKRDAGDAS